MKKQNAPSTKAHVVRGAFYLLLFLAVFVIPLALGQRSATKSGIDAAKISLAVGLSSTSGAAEAQGWPAPSPELTPIALWDQYNSAGSSVTLSATFTDFPPLIPTSRTILLCP